MTFDDLVTMGEFTAEQVEAMRRHKAAGPPPMPSREVAQALRAERERQGLSLTALAERAGLDRMAIYRIEIGANKNPTVATLETIAAALGNRLSIGLEDAAAR